METHSFADAIPVFHNGSMYIGEFPVMSYSESEFMQNVIDVLINGPGSVLEIGFGLGISASAIRKRGNPHTVIEINKSVAEAARKQGYEVVNIDYRLYEPEKKFDFVFCDPYIFDEKSTVTKQFLGHVDRFVHDFSRATWFGLDDGEQLEELARAKFRNVSMHMFQAWTFAVCQLPI